MMTGQNPLQTEKKLKFNLGKNLAIY